MRSLKYAVLALTPLLSAAGFAQGFNLGMIDGAFLLAQAPAQSGSYGATNGSGKPEGDREPGTDRAGTPMGGEIRPDAPAPSAANSKTTSRPQGKTQARKVEKKAKDTGTN
jgi:hypothetical protein